MSSSHPLSFLTEQHLLYAISTRYLIQGFSLAYEGRAMSSNSFIHDKGFSSLQHPGLSLLNESRSCFETLGPVDLHPGWPLALAWLIFNLISSQPSHPPTSSKAHLALSNQASAYQRYFSKTLDFPDPWLLKKGPFCFTKSIDGLWLPLVIWPSIRARACPEVSWFHKPSALVLASMRALNPCTKG